MNADYATMLQRQPLPVLLTMLLGSMDPKGRGKTEQDRDKAEKILIELNRRNNDKKENKGRKGD